MLVDDSRGGLGGEHRAAESEDGRFCEKHARGIEVMSVRVEAEAFEGTLRVSPREPGFARMARIFVASGLKARFVIGSESQPRWLRFLRRMMASISLAESCRSSSATRM